MPSARDNGSRSCFFDLKLFFADLSRHTPWPVLLPDGIIRGKSTNKNEDVFPIENGDVPMSCWIEKMCSLHGSDPMQVGVIFTLLPLVFTEAQSTCRCLCSGASDWFGGPDWCQT